jgi:hypothetical protein
MLGVPFCPEVVSNACLKSNRRLKSEGIVKSFVQKFAVKFIEMAGAGLASALCAYVLGQIERAPAPTPMPAVVYISPANVDTALREDHTRPAAIARTDAETQQETAASAPAATAPKAVKPPAVAQARRNQKPEPGAGAETKAGSGEPLAIQPAAVAANSAPKPVAPGAQAANGRDEPQGWSSGEEDRPLLARLKQIPSWFLPENDRIFGDLPRPPMPVGESLRSAM